MSNKLSEMRALGGAAVQQRAPLVLIVEDNPTNARLTEEMLHAAGYRTLVAEDGSSGLEAARRSSPDLILTDLQMAGMDGLTLVKHLKADPALCAIPVIAVTAHAMAEHRAAALQAGCCRFIAKPFRFRALVEEVSNVIGSAQLH